MTPLGLYLLIMFCLKVAGVGHFSWWLITGPILVLFLWGAYCGARDAIDEHRAQRKSNNEFGGWSGKV